MKPKNTKFSDEKNTYQKTPQTNKTIRSLYRSVKCVKSVLLIIYIITGVLRQKSFILDIFTNDLKIEHNDKTKRHWALYSFFVDKISDFPPWAIVFPTKFLTQWIQVHANVCQKLASPTSGPSWDKVVTPADLDSPSTRLFTLRP